MVNATQHLDHYQKNYQHFISGKRDLKPQLAFLYFQEAANKIDFYISYP